MPDQVLELPVLAVSTALQFSLRAQQQYAALTVRGDELLAELRGGPSDDPPPWAQFDDRASRRPTSSTRRSAAPPAATSAAGKRPARRQRQDTGREAAKKATGAQAATARGAGAAHRQAVGVRPDRRLS